MNPSQQAAPGVGAPGVGVPDVSAPGVGAPDVSAPGVGHLTPRDMAGPAGDAAQGDGPPHPADNPPLGIALFTFAVLLAPIMDAFAKTLEGDHGVGAVQSAVARFSIHLLAMLPLALPVLLRDGQGRRGLRRRLPAHALRGVLLAISVTAFFAALPYMPLANVTAIFFLSPLLVTVLSVPVLGERLGWRRASAVALGFIGAMIVIQPGGDGFNWAAVLPALCALCGASFALLTRRLAVREPVLEMQVFVALSGLLTMATVGVLATLWGHHVLPAPALAAFVLSHTSEIGWLKMLGLGAVATVISLCSVLSYRRAPASLLAPFAYLEIVSAGAIGLVWFAEVPDAPMLIGTGIIIGAGLYVFYREQQLARRHRRATLALEAAADLTPK